MVRTWCRVAGVWMAASAAFGANPPTTQPLPVLPQEVIAKIRIAPEQVERPISPTFLGINLNPGAPRDTLIVDPTIQRKVRAMGMTTIRFPNGCVADTYNFKQPAAGMVTVDGFLDFCEAIHAEAYYTLNMQGGVDGLEGAVPENAGVDERIRYRHTAPNPCGDTRYHFGTLAEALELLKKYTIERALAGKPPILHYELGNENWGQGNTDWPPEVYGKTCEVFANAFRKALSDAQATHSALAGLKLYMVAVGYPTMGNNQDAFKASNRDVNVRWTREMNRLADLKSIDAVQEHFYPYGGADGGTLLWTVHNLTNILCLRNGVPNPRLGGYRNPELAYKLPMEWTEWNVKCWGPLPDVSLPLVNADFTAGAKNWTVQIEPAGAGAVSFERAAARRGPKGLQIKTQASAKQAEVRQILSVASRKPAAAFGAAAWVRTDRPAQTRVLLRQTNDGPSKGIVLGSATATQTNMWERITATGAPKADTTDLEVVLQVEGGGATAWFDEIQPIHWSTFSGVAPLVNTRFEQQLFIVDALRVLLAWPTPRTHLHHLIGDYPCTTLTSKGAARDNAAAFQFLNKRIGDRVVKSDCEVPTFAYNTNADAYATDFNALAPDMTNVPALSVLAMRDGQRLYVLLVNRTTDRTIQANLDFGATTLSAKGDLRTLAGSDFDVSGAAVRTQSVEVVNPLSLAVPPHCAQMLSVGLGEK